MVDVGQLEKELAEKRQKKIRERARRDLCFWMDNAILPFLQGVASSYDEPLLDGVKRLIHEGKNPFRPTQDWDRTNEVNYFLTGFFKLPQTKLLQVMAKPIVRAKTSFIAQEIPWIRDEILRESYPDLYEAVMTTEGGREWLDDLLLDLTNTLKTFLR